VRCYDVPIPAFHPDLFSANLDLIGTDTKTLCNFICLTTC
jgi:hypothetical protein